MDFPLILASISFLLAVVWGPLLIRILLHYNVSKRIRTDGPRSHRTKRGTPTMGGLMIVVPIAAFVIFASANAVSLTDGLDGLAGIIVAGAFAAYGAIALLQGQEYLACFCFTVVGACFAFLWFNAHPTQMFMGDTGALALGVLWQGKPGSASASA